MVINNVKMTGPELKKIYDISGITGDDFAKRLSVSRPTLYLLFKDKIVSIEIEERLMKDQSLKKIRNSLNTDLIQREESPQIMTDVFSLFNKTMEVMQLQQDKFFTRLDRMLDKSESDTEHIKKVNEELLTLMKQGVKH